MSVPTISKPLDMTALQRGQAPTAQSQFDLANVDLSQIKVPPRNDYVLAHFNPAQVNPAQNQQPNPETEKPDKVIPHHSGIKSNALTVTEAAHSELYSLLDRAEQAGIEVVSVEGGKSSNNFEIRTKDQGEVLGKVESSIFAVNGPKVEASLQKELQKVLAQNPGAEREKTAPTVRLTDGLTEQDLAKFGIKTNENGFSVEYHAEVKGPANLKFDPKTDHVTIDRDGNSIRITTYDEPNKDNKIYETVTTVGENRRATLTSETYRSRPSIEIPNTNQEIDPSADARLYRTIEQAQRYGYSVEIFPSKGGGSVATVSNEERVIKGIEFRRNPVPGQDGKQALQELLDGLLSKEKP